MSSETSKKMILATIHEARSDFMHCPDFDSINGIVWFGVVIQCICLVQCCHTMELFGLVLSDN